MTASLPRALGWAGFREPFGLRNVPDSGPLVPDPSSLPYRMLTNGFFARLIPTHAPTYGMPENAPVCGRGRGVERL